MARTREYKLQPFDAYKEIGIGIMTYFTAPAGKIFTTSYTTIDQAKTNFAALLLTNEGERPMQPEFGCNLRKFIFQPINSDMLSDIENIVRSKTAFWLPYIDILKFEVSPEPDLNLMTFDVIIALKGNRLNTASLTLKVTP